MVTPQDRPKKPGLLDDKAKERVAVGQKWQNERGTFTKIEIFCLRSTWDPIGFVEGKKSRRGTKTVLIRILRRAIIIGERKIKIQNPRTLN